MTRLKETQLAFQSYMMSETAAVSPLISNPHKGTVESRLAIYREAYYARLIETLESDFDTLIEVMGHARFHEFAHDYIEAHPSSYTSLDEFGKAFPAFLKKYGSLLEYEIADFEWKMAMTRLLKPQPFLSMQSLETVPLAKWAYLSFDLQAHFQIVSYQHDVLHYYDKRQKKGEEDCVVLIWQKDHRSYYSALSIAKERLISAINEGSHFMRLCEVMLEYLPENNIPAFVSTTLKELVLDELIVGYAIRAC